MSSGTWRPFYAQSVQIPCQPGADVDLREETGQAVPVFVKAFQHVAAGSRQFQVAQFGIGLGPHGRHCLPPFDVGGGEVGAARSGATTATVVAIEGESGRAGPRPTRCALASPCPP